MDNSLLKKLQATELEILKVFDKFCTDNDIRYSLYAGTALGAVRHSGFIPWDDDVDVAMTRGEYNRFIEKIRMNPVKGYTMDSPELNPSCAISHAKMMKDGTVLISSDWECEDTENHGIWIDIFPLDKITDKTKRRIYRIGRKIIFLTRAYGGNKNDGRIKAFIRVLARCIPRPIAKKKLAGYLHELALNDQETQTDYQWTVLAAENTFRYAFESEMMNAMRRTEFEGQRFLITDRYDSMLRRLYGDYMTLPPASKQVCKHQPARIAFQGGTDAGSFTLTAGGNTDIR